MWVFDLETTPAPSASVTSAGPGGNPDTGTEVNDVSDQFVAGSLNRNTLCALARL